MSGARFLHGPQIPTVSALPSAGTNPGRMLRTAAGLFISDGAQWLQLDGTSGVDPWDYIILPSNVAVSTTTYGTVTGLLFPAAANTLYEVEVFATFQAAAAGTGIAMALDIPSGSVSMLGVHTLTAATLSGFEQIADATATGVTTGVRAATTNVPLLFRGLANVGSTPGNVQLLVRSETGGSAVTLQAGLTVMKVRKARNNTSSARILPITQAAYDALATKDANTLYVIVAAPVTGYSHKWVALTAAEYAAITTPDPETLYVVTD